MSEEKCGARRLAAISGLLCLIALGAAIAGHLWQQRTAVPLPPIALAGVDSDAAAAIQAARATLQQQPRAAAAWGRLGMTLYAHDFHQEALTCFAQAEKLDPKDGRWAYFQGLLQGDANASLASIRLLQRAVRWRGDDVTVRLRLGEALLAQDRLADAEAQFGRALELEPGNARAELGLGESAYKRGDFPACLPHLKRAASSPFAQKTAHVLLTQVYRRLGDEPAAAREQLRAAGSADDAPWPDPFMEEVHDLQASRDARLARGERLFLQGKVREGLTLLQEVAAKHPDYERAHLFLGRAYFRLHEYAAVERAFREAVRLASENVEASYLLGCALQIQKQYGAAAECFRRTLETKPDHALARYNLALCALAQGDREGAIQALRAALRYMPNLAEAHSSLGKILAQDGQDADAIRHLEHAVRLAPTDGRAKELLGKLRAAEVPSRAGR